jgi:ClpP class serine protease
LGSIGVVLMHADYSGHLQQKGIRPTLIHAGAHKVDGHPYEPLPDSVRADLQAEVDQFYSLFVSGVAKGRKGRMTERAVRDTEARTYIGEAALKAGLVDTIGSFETVLADLSRGGVGSAAKKPSSGLSMQVNPPALAIALPTATLAASNRTAPAVVTSTPIAGPSPASRATADEIVAAAALWALDTTTTGPAGRNSAIGLGWDTAMLKASGKLPQSDDPGHGWMAVIFKLNAEQPSTSRRRQAPVPARAGAK